MNKISEQNKKLLWIWGQNIFKGSNLKLFKLVEIFGSIEKLYEADREAVSEVRGLKDKEISAVLNKSLADAENIYEKAMRYGAEVYALGEEKYPELLSMINDAPPVIYVKGDIDCLKDKLLIAGVGTRKCDAYSAEKMKQMSYDLASAGVGIVSGLAKGIDSAAHSGALDANGVTAAVLGTAIDRIYPAENYDLYHRIIENGGAVISEHPPGYRGYRSDFLRRNRIIAGLSNGVLVCQAPLGSGSITTAKFALDFGRDTFCIPGNADEINEGGNSLVRDGCAKLVLRAEDILSEYELEFDFVKIEKPKRKNTDANNSDSIHSDGKKADKIGSEFDRTNAVINNKVNVGANVFEKNTAEGLYDDLGDEAKKVVMYLKDGRVMCDQISRDLKIDYALLSSILTELEIEGILRNDNGYVFLEP